MATINFTQSYSDATKGATLKALQLRQQQAEQDMLAQMRPRQISEPEQGWAQVAGTIGAGIREGRAAAQEQAGRQQLAQLLAGGLKDPQSMAQAMVLDPETARAYQEHQWNVEATATEAQQRRDELVQKHGWDVEAATQRVKDDMEKARVEHGYRGEEAQQTAALGSDEAKWEAGLKAGTVSQEAYDTHKQQVAAEAAARGPDQWGPVTPEIAAKYGPNSDVARNPGKYHVNAKTGDVEVIDSRSLSSMLGPGQAATDTTAAKDVSAWETGGKTNAALQMANIQHGINLLDQSKQAGGWATGLLAGTSANYLPDAINRAWNSTGMNARDAILTSVQSTLKQILGSQFTRMEGENLLGRAFNMNASVDENIRRAKMILGQAQLLSQQKDEMSRYYHSTENGKPADSMYGAKAAELDTGALQTMLNDMANADASGNPNQGGGGGEDLSKLSDEELQKRIDAKKAGR